MRLVIAALAICLLSPRLSHACDCAGPPPTERALRDAAVVATVTVTRIVDDVRQGSNWVGTGPRHITVTVERAWKGTKPGEQLTIDRDQRTDCDYELPADTRHLLYLYRERGQLAVTASHCGRSQPLDQATEEIAALDRLVPADGAATPAAGSVTPAPAVVPPTTKPRGCGGCASHGASPTLLLGLAMLFAVRPRRRS